RAGMISTQWFLVNNTQGSAMPRITAAQAYRAYLGFDIAKLQGIFPVANEPKDVDRKGVTERRCALCHSTLDPLTYAFAFYEGITIAGGGDGNLFGSFQPSRPQAMIPDWQDEQGSLLGQPVDDLVSWARHAVTTDAFKQNLGRLLFRHAFDREPEITEQAAFEEIWRSLSEEGWSANRVIHRLIDLPLFGA
ncbi:MAG: hypothetical protein AAFV29_08455, partial [Myxococcota bacterium]